MIAKVNSHVERNPVIEETLLTVTQTRAWLLGCNDIHVFSRRLVLLLLRRVSMASRGGGGRKAAFTVK